MQPLIWVLCAVAIISALFFSVRLARTGALVLIASPFQRDLGSDAPAILVAGDSTAYGTGAFSNTDTIAGRLAGDFPLYSVMTIARNGATVADLYTMLTSAELKNDYAFVVLQIGANDVLQDKDLMQTTESLKVTLSLLKGKTDKMYILTSGNIGAASAYVTNGTPDTKLQLQSLRLRDLFSAVAKDEGAVYVDLYEDPATDAFLSEPKTYLAFDGLHPSGAGYGYWYKKLRLLLPI